MLRHFKLKIPKCPFRDTQNNQNLILSRKKCYILYSRNQIMLNRFLQTQKSCSDGAVAYNVRPAYGKSAARMPAAIG